MLRGGISYVIAGDAAIEDDVGPLGWQQKAPIVDAIQASFPSFQDGRRQPHWFRVQSFRSKTAN